MIEQKIIDVNDDINYFLSFHWNLDHKGGTLNDSKVLDDKIGKCKNVRIITTTLNELDTISPWERAKYFIL